MTSIEDFLDLVRPARRGAADGSTRATPSSRSSGRAFGYLWPPTRTVGLKQTLAEQAALVGERPDVFEVQFTAGGFGWVVVYLDGVERDELAELTFEAWRLSAPAALVAGTRGPAAALIAALTSSVLEVLASRT